MGILSLMGLLLPVALLALAMYFLGWFNRVRPLAQVGEIQVGEAISGDGTARPHIEWLGHSSYRVKWRGHVLLLDPVWSRRVSVARRLCTLPGRDVLAGVDAVLISHAHMDHLDNPTLEKIEPSEVYLPAKSVCFLSRKVRARHCVRPFRQGETIQMGLLRVSVVTARHGGWRYPWQRGYIACGFVISDGKTVLYYAGDTAWGEHFAEIGKVFRPDMAILPIGGYCPRWFLKSRHLNPEEAVRAARELGVRSVIPGHFGTYRVSLEPVDEPLKLFHREAITLQADHLRSAGSRSL